VIVISAPSVAAQIDEACYRLPVRVVHAAMVRNGFVDA
jgi:hypothetical protein